MASRPEPSLILLKNCPKHIIYLARAHAPDWEQRGLRALEVSGEFVDYAFGLPEKYGSEPSTNDYLALALAKQEGCPLLTGDQALRHAAQKEDVSVMGSVWLLRVMVENGLLSVDQALAALALMKEKKRRLPWAEAERVLGGLRGMQ